MAKTSQLTRVEIDIFEGHVTGARATYADAIVDGDQTYQLPSRTEDIATEDDHVLKSIIGDALVAATAASKKAADNLAQAEKARNDLQNQLATIQSKITSTDGVLQQLSTERDQVRTDFDNQTRQVQDLKKQLDDVTAQRDAEKAHADVLVKQLEDARRQPAPIADQAAVVNGRPSAEAQV